MPALLAAVEVRCRGAGPDDLDVQVRRARKGVAKQAAVAVDVVEARVALQPQLGSGRGQPLERVARRVAVALAPELGRVHLDEPDAAAVLEQDRVAVAGGVDRGAAGRAGGAAAARGTEDDGQKG